MVGQDASEPKAPDTRQVIDPATALPADQRPADYTPIHTADLPPTPTRDRNIIASAWIEAPSSVLSAGEDLADHEADSAHGEPPEVAYKRRIGGWLLWRAGPARRGHARYIAVAADDLDVHYFFRLYPDGTGSGVGPSGESHERFRAWKEDLAGR